MDTTKSDKITQKYMQNKNKLKRTVQTFSGTWNTTLEEFFPLLCPTREADWIPGWGDSTELIYTDTGYAESKCIFRTTDESVWMFTDFVRNEYIECVRFQEDVIAHFKISVVDNKNGTVTATWHITTTGITEHGNKQVDQISKGTVPSHSYQELIDNYLKNPNQSKSLIMYKKFKDRPQKFLRKVQEFTGTWNTTLTELYPLFCPAREADWIPGWSCELLYTTSGYAEDKCVFRTVKSNTLGEGIWTFVGYKENVYVDFVRLQENILVHAKISLVDNKDGTVSGTWHITQTVLSKQGNLLISKMDTIDGRPLIKMIDHYLSKGKMVKKTSLAIDKLHTKIRGH